MKRPRETLERQLGCSCKGRRAECGSHRCLFPPHPAASRGHRPFSSQGDDCIARQPKIDPEAPRPLPVPSLTRQAPRAHFQSSVMIKPLPRRGVAPSTEAPRVLMVLGPQAEPRSCHQEAVASRLGCSLSCVSVAFIVVSPCSASTKESGCG